MALPPHRLGPLPRYIARGAIRSGVVALRAGRVVLLVLGLIPYFAVALRATDSVIISEFMTANARTLASNERLFEDWIEIRNTGSNTVNLKG